MYDTHGAVDLSTGTFSAPVSGFYVFLFASMPMTGTGFGMRVLKNGETIITDYLIREFSLYLKLGDIIHLQARCYTHENALLSGAMSFRIWL